MEVRVRERLIGALVLVAIVVLVVPAILKGRDPAPAAPPERRRRDGSKCRSTAQQPVPEEQVLVPEPVLPDAAHRRRAGGRTRAGTGCAADAKPDAAPPPTPLPKAAGRRPRSRRRSPSAAPAPARDDVGVGGAARRVLEPGESRAAGRGAAQAPLFGVRSRVPGRRDRCSTASAWGRNRIARAPRRLRPGSPRTDSSRSSPGTPDRLECRTFRGGPRVQWTAPTTCSPSSCSSRAPSGFSAASSANPSRSPPG